jgi:hypothetical protein
MKLKLDVINCLKDNLLHKSKSVLYKRQFDVSLL